MEKAKEKNYAEQEIDEKLPLWVKRLREIYLKQEESGKEEEGTADLLEFGLTKNLWRRVG